MSFERWAVGVLVVGMTCGCEPGPEVRPRGDSASSGFCLPGLPPRDELDGLGRALGGAGDAALVGQPSVVKAYWWRNSCSGFPRVARAEVVDPLGRGTTLPEGRLVAPHRGLVEGRFTFAPQVSGPHTLRATLQPDGVTVEVRFIAAFDRSAAPVFAEQLERTGCWQRVTCLDTTRTTRGLLVSGWRMFREGVEVPAPLDWSGGPWSIEQVVSVGEVLWTVNAASGPPRRRVSRWTDLGSEVRLDGQVEVLEQGSATLDFIEADRAMFTRGGQPIVLRWDGSALRVSEAPRTRGGPFYVGERLFSEGELDRPPLVDSVCELDGTLQRTTCQAEVNLVGMSRLGPLIRDRRREALGVFGRDGPTWWYVGGGHYVEIPSGLLGDHPVVLTNRFLNAASPTHSLLMTADESGLVFEQYELGPPTHPDRPHKLLAVLHDWLVVDRAEDPSDRVQFIARAPRTP